jgi:hypothetical protein
MAVGSIPVQMDRTREFKIGMKAFMAIEKTLGKSVGELNLKKLTHEEAMIIIWAGILHDDKELTIEKVTDLVDEHMTPAEITDLLSKAFEVATSKNAPAAPGIGKK